MKKHPTAVFFFPARRTSADILCWRQSARYRTAGRQGASSAPVESKFIREEVQMSRSRNRSYCSAVAGLLALLAATAPRQTAAASPEPIAWNADVEAAWKITQEQGRPLLVFVTAKQCAFCVKMKKTTYENAALAATVNRGFVPLVLDGDSDSPLLKDLRVTAYPATFIISRDAIILDRVNGYVPPDVLLSRLAAIHATAQEPPPASRGRDF
jgi:thioredoxin-related protein